MAAPKPLSGPEVVARLIVLEAFVIALVQESPPAGNLRAEALRVIESFNRPELTRIAETYVEEISQRIGPVPAESGKS